MTRAARLAARIVPLLLMSGLLAAQTPPVLPPGSGAGSRTVEQLSIEWWQWAMSAPSQVNPLRDQTGVHCSVGQDGDVWFLAGGFGSSKIRRTCTLPAGKTLFFPVVNMVFWRPRDNPDYTCERARRLAALNNDTAIDLFAEIDGVAVADIALHRVATTECFNVFARVQPPGRAYDAFPSASDGYWLAVRPLPPGRHSLRFGGRYNRKSADFGRMVQDIEYELDVR